MMHGIKFAIFLIVLLLTTVDAGSQDSLFRHELKIDRFGPVKIGMTPIEASKLLGIDLTPGKETGKDDAACHYVYPNGKFGDIGFMVENGRITRIDIYSIKAAAIGGIRVGQSESAIRKVFTGAVTETVHPYIGKEGKYLTIEDQLGHAFVFETDKGTITRFRAGEKKSVQYIEGCL